MKFKNSILKEYLFSISIEPVYPKICVNYDFKKVTTLELNETKKPELMDLCESMNSLCCGINLKHDELFLLPPIMSLVNKFDLKN